MAVQCGHVYFLYMPIASKPKLVVPAFVAEDGRVRYFMINTNRTLFQQNNATNAAHVFELKQQDHSDCLTHNSWLCCDEALGGPTAAQVEKTKDCYRQPLHAQIKAAVLAVVKESRLLSDSDKAAILAQWA